MNVVLKNMSYFQGNLTQTKTLHFLNVTLTINYERSNIFHYIFLHIFFLL